MSRSRPPAFSAPKSPSPLAPSEGTCPSSAPGGPRNRELAEGAKNCHSLFGNIYFNRLFALQVCTVQIPQGLEIETFGLRAHYSRRE